MRTRGAIRVACPKSKMPNALKLMSQISSFLFEEEFGECGLMKSSEVEALRKAVKALSRAHGRSQKSE